MIDNLPDGWEVKKLGDIGNISAGGTPSRSKPEYWNNGSIPWVKIADMKEKHVKNTSEFITEEGLNKSSAKIFKKGTILISIFASLGTVGILDIDASTNQAIAGINVNSKKVIPEYLYYYLKSLKNYFMGAGRGVAQNNINLSILKDTEIFVPPLETQQKIVEILEKIEYGINLREKAILETENLVKAVFLDMFGDPVSNPMGWDVKKIGTFVNDIISGWSVGGDERPKKADELAVLKISSVTSGKFKSSEHKVVNSEITKKLVHPLKGDLLFSRANTRELVAAVCIVDNDYMDLFLPDKLWKIILNKNIVSSYYFRQVLQDPTYRANLTKKATGTSGSMLNISKSKLIENEFPIPPIGLQNKFAKIIEKLEEIKEKQENSKKEMDLSLQKAFKGELAC